MTTKEALLGFYKFNRLNLNEDFKSHCVRVYIGCLLAPVPNLKARKKYLKFHDLHHILTGYGIGRIGESEISSWELGSGSCRKPLISVMNLFALSTGFILKPQRVKIAFNRGCRSRNLYYLSDSLTEPEIDNLKIKDLKKDHLEIKEDIKHRWLRQCEFFGYVLISMFIHLFMLVAGKALLMAESVKNKLTNKKEDKSSLAS